MAVEVRLRGVGLTESEARSRHQRGEGNNTGGAPSRSYGEIARANLFTLFNNILFTIGIALIALGRTNDAITSVGLGLVNALISTVQEIRAKRQFDRIALLYRPTATAVRDGREQTIAPTEIVKGDVLRVDAGDLVVVDGVMLGDGLLEMAESLLTGETDLIRKRAGDQILSGSYCVTGSGYMQAEKVGGDSFANQLMATARKFEVTLTPLQRQINLVVRLVMLVVVVISIMIFVASPLEGLSTVQRVQIAAVLSGQVPYGLFLMIVVAYALGASPPLRAQYSVFASALRVSTGAGFDADGGGDLRDGLPEPARQSADAGQRNPGARSSRHTPGLRPAARATATPSRPCWRRAASRSLSRGRPVCSFCFWSRPAASFWAGAAR